MNRDFRDFGQLILHTVLGAALLAVWIVTAWATDHYLLTRFPLEGATMIGFRVLEVTIHLKLFQIVWRIMFNLNMPKDPPNRPWWA